MYSSALKVKLQLKCENVRDFSHIIREFQRTNEDEKFMINIFPKNFPNGAFLPSWAHFLEIWRFLEPKWQLFWWCEENMFNRFSSFSSFLHRFIHAAKTPLYKCKPIYNRKKIVIVFICAIICRLDCNLCPTTKLPRKKIKEAKVNEKPSE